MRWIKKVEKHCFSELKDEKCGEGVKHSEFSLYLIFIFKKIYFDQNPWTQFFPFVLLSLGMRSLLLIYVALFGVLTWSRKFIRLLKYKVQLCIFWLKYLHFLWHSEERRRRGCGGCVCGQEDVVVHVGQGVIVVVVVAAAIIVLRTLTFGFVPRGQFQQNLLGSFFTNRFMVISQAQGVQCTLRTSITIKI